MDKVYALISGGKDSTASLLKASEIYTDIEAIFVDTGMESRYTYEYIDYLEEKTGIKIHRLKPDKSIFDVFRKYLPDARLRACTGEIKIRTIRKFIKEHIGKYDKIILISGVRKDESHKRAKRYEGIKPTDLILNKQLSYKKLPVYNQYPIIDWTTEEVFRYIFSKGLNVNKLYYYGFSRVGCFPCVLSRIEEIKLCLQFKEGLENIRKIVQIVEEAEKEGRYIPVNYKRIKNLYYEHVGK